MLFKTVAVILSVALTVSGSAYEAQYYKAADTVCLTPLVRLFRAALPSGVNCIASESKCHTEPSPNASQNMVEHCIGDIKDDLPKEMGSSQYVVIQNFISLPNAANTCAKDQLKTVQAVVADETCVHVQGNLWTKASCKGDTANVWSCDNSDCTSCVNVISRGDESCHPAYDVGFSKVKCIPSVYKAKSDAGSVSANVLVAGVVGLSLAVL